MRTTLALNALTFNYFWYQNSIIDLWQGPRNATEWLFWINILMINTAEQTKKELRLNFWKVRKSYLHFLIYCNKCSCMKRLRIRGYYGPHFLAFGLNTERYSVSLRIQSECGKMRARITPNTDTFYAKCSKCFVFSSEKNKK